MNKKKFFKIILFTILVVVITCLGFVGNYFYNLALNPDTPKDIIFGTPEEASTTSGWQVSHYKMRDNGEAKFSSQIARLPQSYISPDKQSHASLDRKNCPSCTWNILCPR